jgi:hypothetical protein
MGARWYDGGSANFLIRDTILGELHTPISLNRYTYGWANPNMYWDPDGRSPNTPMIEGECSGVISCGSTNIGQAELTTAQIEQLDADIAAVEQLHNLLMSSAQTASAQQQEADLFTIRLGVEGLGSQPPCGVTFLLGINGMTLSCGPTELGEIQGCNSLSRADESMCVAEEIKSRGDGCPLGSAVGMCGDDLEKLLQGAGYTPPQPEPAGCQGTPTGTNAYCGVNDQPGVYTDADEPEPPKLTEHGRQQLTERGFDPLLVELVLASPNEYEQADGAIAHVAQVGETFNVIVIGRQGVVTGFRGITQQQLDTYAYNYEWNGYP